MLSKKEIENLEKLELDNLSKLVKVLRTLPTRHAMGDSVLATPDDMDGDRMSTDWEKRLHARVPALTLEERLLVTLLVHKLLVSIGGGVVKPKTGNIVSSVAKYISKFGFDLHVTLLGNNQKATVGIKTPMGIVIVYENQELVQGLLSFSRGYLEHLGHVPKPRKSPVRKLMEKANAMFA